jgi:hypothetical protein
LIAAAKLATDNSVHRTITQWGIPGIRALNVPRLRAVRCRLRFVQARAKKSNGEKAMQSSMQAFALLLPSLPLFAVYLVGLIYSSTKLGQCRRVATLGMTGFALLLAARIVSTGGNLMTLPQYRGSMTIQELTGRLAMLNLVATLLILAGTIVLIVALFADRDKKPALG